MRWQLIVGGAALLGGCHRSASSSSSDPPRLAVASLVACAARDGHATCWGDNDHRETSQPVMGGRAVVSAPTAVEGIDDATGLTTAEHRTCTPAEGCSSRAKPAAAQSAIIGEGKGGQTGHGATPEITARKVDWRENR